MHQEIKPPEFKPKGYLGDRLTQGQFFGLSTALLLLVICMALPMLAVGIIIRGGIVLYAVYRHWLDWIFGRP